MEKGKRNKGPNAALSTESQVSQVDESLEIMGNGLPAYVGKATCDPYNGGSGGVSSPMRRNRAGSINRTDLYKNIEMAPIPFSKGKYSNTISPKAILDICYKAYLHFPKLKLLIETMVELENGKIYLQGGNDQTNSFIEAWLQKIDLAGLKEQFFRERLRSANVFMYRLFGELDDTDIKQMTQLYGANASKLREIPIRYQILDASKIVKTSNLSFLTPIYSLILSPEELAQLQNPITQEDIDILNNFTPEERQQIKNGTNPVIRLNPKNLATSFYKKQDYEDFGIPMAHCVLEKIDALMEMSRIDMAIARTVERSILLVTTGAEPDKGGVNPQALTMLQTMFQNETVGRVLVADHTTKAEFVIPDINKILGAEKYQQLNSEINEALNSVLFSSNEKFANASIKIQVFTEKLREERNAFLKFLNAEIKEICKLLGKKSYPEALFTEFNLRDDLQYARLYTQLGQLGILTPIETLDAINTGRLPTKEDSIANQKEFKPMRDDELYVPLLGGQDKQDPSGGTGRPADTQTPKSQNTTSPIGTKSGKASQDIQVGANKFLRVYSAYIDLNLKATAAIKKHFKVKKLNDNQEKYVGLFARSLALNEPMETWIEKIPSYIQDGPKEVSENIEQAVDKLSIDLQCKDRELATALYLSQI